MKGGSVFVLLKVDAMVVEYHVACCMPIGIGCALWIGSRSIPSITLLYDPVSDLERGGAVAADVIHGS